MASSATGSRRFGGRAQLAFASSLLALTIATPAFAQENTPAPTQDPITAAPEADDVATGSQQPGETDIVVTGSRIARPEISSPNPMVSYSAATLEQSGRTNLVDFLVQNPALLASDTSQDQSGSNGDFGATGANLLNLRNL